MDAYRWILVSLLLVLAFGADSLVGQNSQIWVGSSDTQDNPRWAMPEDFEGSSLIFCRGYYKSNRYEQGAYGWYVDYPGADYNLLSRLSELTKVRIRRESNGDPVHVVVRLDSPLIYNCPVIFFSEAGVMNLGENEVVNIHKYLNKGGFMWFDDFWGSASWDHWTAQIRKVLPSYDYPIIDISPNHPIMNQVFTVKEIPQIPNIGFWYQTNKRTSERGEDSRYVHFRGILDGRGRLVVVATHNTDIGEAWEREGFDSWGEYFHEFSTIGYAIGINIFVYALTH